ncbi:flavoprotein [Natronosporangium hydrolyticum]|uniref:Flavoprotein n=1 Tax=Natronosporangium hydrolyticum TaxID=2811111 RepID=A0A895YIJ6_9ACTN|nr:flavoprotein [Natronosporangium hydrolyticum]
MAQHAGWQVCVIATPDGRKFIDAEALAAQTGYPVRCHYKHPGDRDLLPRPDAIVVAPATVNTVNKWSCGIADTLALGVLVEGYGLGLPIVVMPYTNTAMAAHPAFHESLRRLRAWGVRVLFGDDVLPMPAPGTGSRQAAHFPWRLVLAAVGPPQRRPANTARGVATPTSGPAALRNRSHRAGPDGRTLLAPPAAPRPAPALRRGEPLAERAG